MVSETFPAHPIPPPPTWRRTPHARHTAFSATEHRRRYTCTPVQTGCPRMLSVHLPCRFMALAAILASSLVACGFNRGKEAPPPLGETFGAEDTYSRSYPVAPASACEAARRALLGQGYVIGKATVDTLEAIKSFQPESDVHTQLNVRATCVPKSGGGSIVFVNAVQDLYSLKTTTKSASVGLSVLGSVSLPIGTSGANLVRVASNTVQNTDFYSR